MRNQPDDRRLTADPAEDLGDEIDLLAILRTLWRGKFFLAVCVVLAGAYGWYRGNVVETPLFRATVTLALNFQTTPAVDLGAVMSGVSGDALSLNTEMEVISSRALIGQLVDRLDLVNDPAFNPWLAPPDDRLSVRSVLSSLARRATGAPPPEPEQPPGPEQQRQATISVVQDSVSATTTNRSYLFSISATAGDPDDAVMLANTLAEVYRDDQIQQKAAATETAAVWLSERTTELGREVEAAQDEINALRAESPLASPEALAALTAQATATEASRLDTEAALTAAERLLALIEAAADSSAAARAEATGDAQLRALAAEADAGDAAAILRFDRRFDQVLQQARGDRDRLAAAVTTLRADAEAQAAQIAAATVAVTDITRREEELQATRLLYETFLTRLKETSLQAGGHQADARVLNEAIDASQIAPRKVRILGIALMAGLMLGAGIVLLREFLQNTYRTADELERRTGITVLGQVPRIPARTRPDTIAYLADKPTSAAAEAIRNLRTSILLSNVDRPPQVILSTSSVPGEGKTTLAIALAQNLAGLDKRVLLIEGDIRRRTFTAYFPDAARNAGLLSVISRKVPLADAVWRHPVLKIDVLMGEKSSINAADVFSSESFRELMAELRTAYDFIIIDTPPVLVVPDARVIAPMVDSVIYAVNWDKTSRSQVDEGLKQLRTVNVHVTGLVLSQIDPKGMRRYGHGGNYGAYSRYAKGYYDA